MFTSISRSIQIHERAYRIRDRRIVNHIVKKREREAPGESTTPTSTDGPRYQSQPPRLRPSPRVGRCRKWRLNV